MVSRGEKRRAAVRRRLQRLEVVGSGQVSVACQRLDPLLSTSPLRVRHGFAYRPHAPTALEYSDRKVPPPAERPPATSLLSPTGSALRLELILLGIAQRRRAGSGFRNDLPLRPGYGPGSNATAWAHLITTPAQYASKGRVRATTLEKRQRSLASALDALASAGLVEFPRMGDAQGMREGFLLMDERVVSPSDAMTYRVPTAAEAVFSLPVEFLREGWVHVLEDSEIAVLLMVYCGLGSIPDSDGWIAIPAAERLLNYGISRDNFSAAHPILKEMGLLEVQSVGRHADGQVIDFSSEGPSLHRLRPVSGGLDQDAYAVARATLERLSRD